MNSTEITSSEGILNPQSESLQINSNTEVLPSKVLIPAESSECGFGSAPLYDLFDYLNSRSRTETPTNRDRSSVHNTYPATVEHFKSLACQRLQNNRARLVGSKDYNLFLSKSPQKSKSKHADLHQISDFGMNSAAKVADEFATVADLKTMSCAESDEKILPNVPEVVA